MTSIEILIDANVFMYAAGGPHRYRDPCRVIVQDLATTGSARGRSAAVDTELFQELAYRYASIGRPSVGLRLQQSLLALELPILPVGTQVLHHFLRHQSTYADALAARRVSMRDLLHLAVATRHGVGAVLTADRDFDQLGEVQRVDPIA